ncbi:MAG: hypothetical protein SGILL_003238 [Bacillariaceae sp.]
MAQEVYDEEVAPSSRRKRYLRGLFELQVSSEIGSWIEHACPMVAGVGADDLCVEMTMASTMGVNAYEISSELFKEVFDDATSSCSFELKFLESERNLPISFLTQQNESGDLICGEPIFVPQEPPSVAPVSEETNVPTTTAPTSEPPSTLEPTTSPTTVGLEATAAPTSNGNATETLFPTSNDTEIMDETLSPFNISFTLSPSNETVNTTVETSDIFV